MLPKRFCVFFELTYSKRILPCTMVQIYDWGISWSIPNIIPFNHVLSCYNCSPHKNFFLKFIVHLKGKYLFKDIICILTNVYIVEDLRLLSPNFSLTSNANGNFELEDTYIIFWLAIIIWQFPIEYGRIGYCKVWQFKKVYILEGMII